MGWLVTNFEFKKNICEIKKKTVSKGNLERHRANFFTHEKKTRLLEIWDSSICDTMSDVNRETYIRNENDWMEWKRMTRIT